MKKYKVTTKPLVGEDGAREYIVSADNEGAATKIALDRMISEELNNALLDSPAQTLIAEEVGYFYGHPLEAHHITDVIDNMEAYIAEMRDTTDMETIPKALTQYAWEYFREVELSRDKLKQLAVFIVDNTYRIISQLTINDNYTRSFFTSVISFLWDKLQDKGVDLFYVLDNELRADRFNCAVELFKLTGMAIVTPSVDGRNLDYDEVERQIKDHMASLKMIMYIEKDAQVNYIEKVLGLAEGTSYLRILRNKAPDDPNIVVFDQ